MKLLGITGYKQAGKDTVAGFVTKLLHPNRVVRHNFADALKAEIARGAGVTLDYIEAHKPAFRLIMQGWGTDFRRNLSGENYWTEQWVKRFYDDAVVLPDTYLVVCTDVRFLNEAALIKELGGSLIRVLRPGHFSDGHASEVEQTKIVVDYTIDNDSYEPISLMNKTKSMLTKLNITHETPR